MGPTTDPHRRSTSSDTSTEELSPALLGAIQRIVTAALQEHVSVAAPPRLAPPPEAEVLEEEGEEEAPVPVLPAGRRRDIPDLNLRRCPRNGLLAWSICKKVCRT
ncbi:UNVERIFIED_CONTAM: hypothetical protein Slati_0177600 [Sesamum latifolium]|uniref:Uncharacterized protein n=1 Tax=Sesamum latifolium TaxID=2727402 RepID=A0AAW2YBR1_9LAMI